MAFVCKQTAVLVVRINNIGQQQYCFNGLVGMIRTCKWDTINGTVIVAENHNLNWTRNPWLDSLTKTHQFIRG